MNITHAHIIVVKPYFYLQIVIMVLQGWLYDNILLSRIHLMADKHYDIYQHVFTFYKSFYRMVKIKVGWDSTSKSIACYFIKHIQGSTYWVIGKWIHKRFH